jgi:hypothetical protein
VDLGDNDQRTMTAQQIIESHQRGEVTADTYVWTEGMADWQRVGDVPELAQAVSPAKAMPEVRAATRTGAGRGSATDLFGDIEKAGSEEDVQTSAPEPTPPPAATGARNESSVLFSLSALTAGTGAEPAPPPAARASSANEDSGLIDLKAMSASIGSGAGGGSPLGAPPLGGSPLGMGAPLGGLAAAPVTHDFEPMQQKSGSKTGLLIAGAVLVVGLAGVAAFAMKGGDTPPVADPTATAAREASPDSDDKTAKADEAKADDEKKDEEKQDEATAAPPPTGEAAPAPAASPQPSTSKVVSAPRPSPAPRAKASPSPSPAPAPAAAPAPAPAPAPRKKPATKKCVCKPSDLLCAMRCKAK